MASIQEGAHYDVVVIGGGAAGLVSSGFVRALGLKVALVSDGHPGGECLWTGCVPSKALIHSAHIASIKGSAEESFSNALKHMKESRAKISHHDSVETIEGGSGVEVLIGRAKFLDNKRVKINETTISASKFIIATGGYQSIPPIEGFDKINCLTHESILELQSKPESLCIIGAGPVGVEYAQTMARLGVKVYLVEYLENVLPREEPEVSALVKSILEKEGVQVFTNCGAIKARLNGDKKEIHVKDNKTGEKVVLKVSEVLVATGKTPATKELGLENTDVSLNTKGFIKVDKSQKTTSNNVWACGDVCGLYQFTHYADHLAQIAALNTCFPAFSQFIKREETVIPWCTFFDPEVASVGLRVVEAEKQFGKNNIHVLKFSLDDFDRAILDDSAIGFMQAVIDGKGTILGATIIGSRAGEIIHEFSLAMKNKIPITGLGKTIHVYPTMSAAVRNLAAQYYKTVAKDSFGLKFARTLAAWMK